MLRKWSPIFQLQKRLLSPVLSWTRLPAPYASGEEHPPSSAAVRKRHRRRAYMRPPPAPAHIDVARSVRRAATASRANHRPPAEPSHQGPSPARTPASHSSRAHPISGCVLPPYCSELRCKPSHGPPSTIRLENEDHHQHQHQDGPNLYTNCAVSTSSSHNLCPRKPSVKASKQSSVRITLLSS